MQLGVFSSIDQRYVVAWIGLGLAYTKGLGLGLGLGYTKGPNPTLPLPLPLPLPLTRYVIASTLVVVLTRYTGAAAWSKCRLGIAQLWQGPGQHGARALPKLPSRR